MLLKNILNPFAKGSIWKHTYISFMIKTFILLAMATGGEYANIALLGAFTSIPILLVYFCFTTAVFSVGFLFKGRAQFWFLIAVNLHLTILFIFDLWYFRAFGNFTTFHLIRQTTNLGNLSGSIFSMVRVQDFILLADISIFMYLYLRKKEYYKAGRGSFLTFVILLAVSIGCIGLVHLKTDVLEKGKKHTLFRTCWSPNQTISNLSPIGYHIYDLYMYINEEKPLILNSEERKEIKAWFDDKKEVIPDNGYKAMFKGMNLIVIQVESLENFVIGQRINGQEITPNINSLLKNSLYFSEFYEQVYNGTSSDADLLTNTSVYPVRRGSTFFRFPKNKYNSLPILLQGMGYYTTAIHPDKGSYWNWMEALESIGFNKCIDAASFVQDESIGLGLSDGSFFRQVVPIIKKQKMPFYTFMVTLSNHSPFDIPNKYRKLNLDVKLDKTKLGGYFQSINYTDRQIGEFISNLKRNRLLDNTVIVIYGDHEGIHKFHKDDILKVKPSEDWWLDNGKRVPLIVFQNEIEGKIINTIGGQVDILPTISYLMGVEENRYMDTAMGRNLLKTNKSFVVLADRKFIGNNDSKNKEENDINGIDIADKIISGNYFSNH